MLTRHYMSESIFTGEITPAERSWILEKYRHISLNTVSTPPRISIPGSRFESMSDFYIDEESHVFSGPIQSIELRILKFESIIRIQRWWRVHSRRRDLIRCVARIQATWKMYLVRKEYRNLRLFVIFIQSRVRMVLQRTRFLRLQRSIIKSQSIWRGILARRQIKQGKEANIAAIVIQSVWRMYRERSRFEQIRLATIRLQSFARMYIQRHNFLTIWSSCIYIQQFWRLYQSQRNHVSAMNQAATTIQSFIRMKQSRRKYTELRNAAVTIQIWMRGLSQKRKIKLLIEQKRKEKMVPMVVLTPQRTGVLPMPIILPSPQVHTQIVVRTFFISKPLIRPECEYDTSELRRKEESIGRDSKKEACTAKSAAKVRCVSCRELTFHKAFGYTSIQDNYSDTSSASFDWKEACNSSYDETSHCRQRKRGSCPRQESKWKTTTDS